METSENTFFIFDDEPSTMKGTIAGLQKMGLKVDLRSNLSDIKDILEEISNPNTPLARKNIAGFLVDQRWTGEANLGSIGRPDIKTLNGHNVGWSLTRHVLLPVLKEAGMDSVPVGLISAGMMDHVHQDIQKVASGSEYENLFLFSKLGFNPKKDLAFTAFSKGKHQLYQLEMEDEKSFNQLDDNQRYKLIDPTKELLASLREQRMDINQLTSRQFEEVTAELMDNMGWDVTLTQMTRDGGADILAYLPTEFGRILCIVETKRYRADRTIGVGLIRELYGSMIDHGASTAMMVTTSTFSKPAREFERKYEYRLGLRDFRDVSDWIAKYRG